MVTIKRYTEDEEASLFEMIKRAGTEWEEYYDKRRELYKIALNNSIVYVVCDGDVLCGYCRCRDDNSFGVYIYDLLVDENHRGKQLGNQLMARVRLDFPDSVVYVMSDVDPYYEKQGYKRVGSIFEVRP